MANTIPPGNTPPATPPTPQAEKVPSPPAAPAAPAAPPAQTKATKEQLRAQATSAPIDPADLARVRQARAQAWFDAAVKGAPDVKPVNIPGLENGEYAVCPVLGSLIAEGSLKVDANGDIQLKDLYEVMVNRLGISPERAAVTVSTGVIGNVGKDLPQVLKGHFNIKDLKGSLLDHQHQGDTGVLGTSGSAPDSGKDNASRVSSFHPERFVALLAHSQDGKTLTLADFSAAITDQLKQAGAPGALPKAESEDVFEMAALINTFGTVDAQGVRRIDFQALFNLYRNQQLPSKDALMSRAATGIGGHVVSMGIIDKDIAKGVGGAVKDAITSACPFLNRRGAGTGPAEPK